jgi:hypothetical protein
MTRNIHQRRVKTRKASPANNPTVSHIDEQISSPMPIAVSSVVKHSVVAGKGGISQEVMDARVAELPWEMKRIAFFSVGVVILLVILWFILR